MKINVLAVLGLSLFGSGHAEVGSEASKVSNSQRELAMTFENACGSATGTDKCCASPYGMGCSQQAQVRNDFRLVVPKGSCSSTEDSACIEVGILTMGEYSCVGHSACNFAGNTDDGVGKATIGSNSCRGKQSCQDAGMWGEATIGSNSCINSAGDSSYTCAAAGNRNKAVIGDNSCNGSGQTCYRVGTGGVATIGNGSCQGASSCYDASNMGSITIGDSSCNGDTACIRRNNVVIGSGSCNCPGCCGCLASGAIVPDNKCNSQGTGDDECCDGGTPNPNFDFSNQANHPLTSPTPPGSTPPGALVTYDAAPEYDIALSSCEFTPASGSSDIGDITCTFNTFGGVDYSVSSVLYNADCSSAVAPTGVSQDASPSFSPALVGDSTTQESSTYAVTLSLANSAAPADSSSIAFCLRSEVKDKDGDVYDWIGQKIQLDINVDGTFSTDALSTTTFDGTTENAADAGDASFGVSVMRCDSNGNEVARNELSLGENFFLCVEGDQTAVVINSIREMTATKDGVTDMSLVAAVGDGSGEGDRNPNTFVYGYGSNKVVIATRLPAPFFEVGGAVTLSGTANIGTGGRRRLGRSMQEAADESAGFSMEVAILGSDSSSGASAIKSTAALFFGTLFAAALFV